jgi:hypothetical protein
LNYNTFSVADHQAEIRSCRLPGFLGHDMTPVALIVFCTQWRFPNRWIEHVINAEHERGLVLHMESYDISNFEYEHFHSYTSTDSPYLQSGHCAILINEYRPTFDEMKNGDHDPSGPRASELDEDGRLRSCESADRALPTE